MNFIQEGAEVEKIRLLWFIEDWNENYRVRRWELNGR